MENHFNCIYCYTNKVNGKKYVGQTVNFIKRHKRHFYNAHNPKHNEYNFYFSRSIRKRTNHDFKKYEEIYSVEILKEDLSTQEELNYWEDYYILEFDLLHKNGKGYNCKLNSINGQIGNPFAGKTEEEIKSIYNSERNQKISNALKNGSHYMCGKHHSEEHKRQLSEKMKGENGYWYGKTLSEEHKKRIAENHVGFNGKAHSEETRKKMSKNHANFKNENHPQAKKVKQIDIITKEIVKIWDTKKQAEEFIKHQLSYYLTGKGKGKPYKGYIWEYVE